MRNQNTKSECCLQLDNSHAVPATLCHSDLPVMLLNGAGICFGHRKLIQLSPKKTWEGFIGGCLTTVVASWYLSGFLSRYKWMTCPRTVRHT